MTTAPHENRVTAMRRFNRFYTRQIGVLRKTFLDSPYSLAEARVLYEIASHGAPTASEIARNLDLDAGYLSRVLRNFEKRGLIRKTMSPKDARQSHLTLTPRGRKSFTPLDARSQRAAAAMLEKLVPADQARLIEAMVRIENLLGGCAQSEPARLGSYILRLPRRQAISAGSSSATPSFTRRNIAGSSPSRACARRSSPISSTNSMKGASVAGSPRSTGKTPER
jgi:DNA-binding MarR family transcriptional regulator